MFIYESMIVRNILRTNDYNWIFCATISPTQIMIDVAQVAAGHYGSSCALEFSCTAYVGLQQQSTSPAFKLSPTHDCCIPSYCLASNDNRNTSNLHNPPIGFRNKSYELISCASDFGKN